jgi:hypothetical protein
VSTPAPAGNNGHQPADPDPDGDGVSDPRTIPTNPLQRACPPGLEAEELDAGESVQAQT